MPDLVFVHVAVATMELQVGVENVSLQFGGEELGWPYPFHYQLFACLMICYMNIIKRKFIAVNAIQITLPCRFPVTRCDAELSEAQAR